MRLFWHWNRLPRDVLDASKCSRPGWIGFWAAWCSGLVDPPFGSGVGTR